MIEIKHKLTGAVLHVFKSKNLRGADLRGADLRGADLGWANLSGANLSGAVFAPGWVLARAEETQPNPTQPRSNDNDRN